MNILIQSIIYSFKKTKKYKINTISWFLADIALYSSVFLLYLLLGLSLNSFGTYTKNQMLFYISTYTLVNNIYAVLFSEGVSSYSSNIMNGYFPYDLLTPQRLLFGIFMKNINFPPLLSTPFLLGINIYLMNTYSPDFISVILYYSAVLMGAIAIMLIFAIVYSFQLFKFRTSSLSEVVLQLLELAEKPDSVFPKKVKNFFTFIIPAFLMSALPSRIILKDISVVELLWIYLSPIIYFFVFLTVFKTGIRRFESEVE